MWPHFVIDNQLTGAMNVAPTSKGILTEGAYTVIMLLNKTYVSLDTTPSTTGQERYFYEFGLYNTDI
jgi:hypothetical protein